ncbi:MAG: M12 family metallopeptidase [Bryobacterales bacterium]|nr:M12 family metallopeptidase [Bryobacterales bacterium]
MSDRLARRLARLSAVTLVLWPFLVSAPAQVEQGPEAQKMSSPSGALAPERLFTTTFRGRELPYVVVDGMAVHSGDIVLGRVEDIVRRPLPPRVSARYGHWDVPSGRALAPEQDDLWPEGIVPYVIDNNVSAEQRQDTLLAIRAWNNKTVVSLIPRTTEANYVRFSNVESGLCRSWVGMVGGAQEISLVPGACRTHGVAHEIGHALGLWHEHEREDRDLYVTVLTENVNPDRRDWYEAEYAAVGPYDYASVMHYGRWNSGWNAGGVFETIPPGMHIPSAGLSAGDIDGVARLYGQPPEKTSVTTNPPGLEILVDGERLTTPASFDWSEGSIHTVEAPVSQILGGTRYLFGRWNDGGKRARTFVASENSTWLEANFILQHSVGSSAEPGGTGTVNLIPESPDGYYTLRTEVQAHATPGSRTGREFLQWAGILYGPHGRSSNPAPWRVTRPGKVFEAVFTDRPLLRIQANVDSFRMHLRDYYVGVDEWELYAPVNLVTDIRRNRIGLRIDETQEAHQSKSHRYRFESWSSGGARSRTLTLPRDGGSMTARFTSEFALVTDVADTQSGTVRVEPGSPDSFYEEGAPVRLSAVPSPGWEFVEWRGDIRGRDEGTTLEIRQPTGVEAVFSQTREVPVGSPIQVSLPATDFRFYVYDSEGGFRIEPPTDSREIRVSYQATTPGADVDLFVMAGGDRLDWHYGDDGRTPVFDADFRSTGPGGRELVVINEHSDPPLDPSETYFAALVVFSPRTTIQGALSAEAERWTTPRPSATTRPSALTFVSAPDTSPGDQVIRLENEGEDPFRYALEVDQAWLTATPADGLLQGGSTTEIRVGALPGGVLPEAYGGNLTVLASATAAPAMEAVATIPVTYVVVPRGSADGDDPGVAAPIVESAENAASRAPGAAPGSNLYLFGSNLASGDPGTLPAGIGPGAQPTVLQGTSVTIIDSARNAYLASLNRVSPSFMSLAVPEDLSLGTASLTVWRGTELSEPFEVQITHVAPGLFSANLDGTGPAWGDAVRVDASGAESRESVSTIHAPIGGRTAIPINLGAGSDKVYLGLWATGIRSWIQEVEAMVGGLAVDVYDVATSGFGLDWVSLGPLPRALSGRGEVVITMTVDGRQSNSVTAFIE